MKPRFRDLGIRTRLLLLCLAVAMPLAGICGVIIWKEYQGLTQTAHRTTVFQDDIAVRSLSQWLIARESELQSLAVLPAIQRLDATLTSRLLKSQKSSQTCWYELALVDARSKKTVCTSARQQTQTLIDFDFIKKTIATGQVEISDYMRCPLTGQPAVLVAAPVYLSGKLDAVLVGSIKLSAIVDLFVGLGEQEGSVITVTDNFHRVLARTLHHEQWSGKDFSQAKTVLAASHIRRGTIEVVGIADPIARLYAFDHEPETGWLVEVGIPTSLIHGSAYDRLIMMIAYTVLAAVFSVALAYTFTGYFTGPIHELVREAVSIGRGNLNKRVKLDDGGELGLLARAFNQMAVNLEMHHEHRGMVERISESIRQSLDLDQILNTTVRELGQSLGASRCCLAMVGPDGNGDSSGNQLEFNYTWWDEQRAGTPLKNRSVLITPTSILKVLLEQRAILSLDVMDQSHFTPMFEKTEESPEDWKSVKCLIACPIVLNQQPIGMILVHQCDYRRCWIEPELDLVEAIARHVALAVEHGRLFTNTKRLAEQESLINHIVRSTRESLDTDIILSTVTQELGRALSADYCHIAQPSAEQPLVITHEYHRSGLESKKGLSLYGNNLDFRPTVQESQDLRSVLGIDLGILKNTDSALDRWTLLEAPVAVISDTTTDKRAEPFREFLTAVGTKSLIAALLLHDDHVLGILIVQQTTTARQWQTSDMRLIAAVADQLSVAISHAQLFEQVKHQAITDGLTGLYNHIYFKNRLTEELNRAQRKKSCCSLIMMDLDKLKEINDTRGHPVGDVAIRHVAHTLRSLLRSGDTAARYGGEEFAVILPETSESEATLIAERLRLHIHRDPAPVLGHISVSCGVATFPSQAPTIGDLVSAADQALYTAKHRGRNQVCRYEEPTKPAISSETASESSFARSLVEEEREKVSFI